MKITHWNRNWNPFKEMDRLQNELASFFGSGLTKDAPTRAESNRELLKLTDWTPLVDITEDDKEYLIKTDLPEVKKDDLRVKVEEGVLTIEGERHFENEEKDKKFHRVERSYGSFRRSFSIPDDADEDKVDAEFKDGILTVHLAKHTVAKPQAKSVNVKVQ